MQFICSLHEITTKLHQHLCNYIKTQWNAHVQLHQHITCNHALLKCCIQIETLFSFLDILGCTIHTDLCSSSHCPCTTMPPGGYKQKARWHADAASSGSPSSGSSALADFLVDRWAWGEFSATIVQKLAACAKQDGLNNPQIEVLAKLVRLAFIPTIVITNCSANLECLTSSRPFQL